MRRSIAPFRGRFFVIFRYWSVDTGPRDGSDFCNRLLRQHRRRTRRLGDGGTVAAQPLLGEVVNRLHPQPVSRVGDPGILQRDGHAGGQGSLAIEHRVDLGAVESDPLDHLRALGALGKTKVLDHETRVGRVAHGLECGLGHVDLMMAWIVDVVRSAVLVAKHDPPVTIYARGPAAVKIAAQPMDAAEALEVASFGGRVEAQ